MNSFQNISRLSEYTAYQARLSGFYYTLEPISMFERKIDGIGYHGSIWVHKVHVQSIFNHLSRLFAIIFTPQFLLLINRYRFLLMNLLVLNFSHFSYRYFSRCSWGIPPKPGLLINVEGSINKFKRIPIRDKFARINLHRNKSFIQNAMLFQTTLLPSFPKSFPATWLPDILNDIQPTVLHYPEIFPSHYIPSKDEVSLFPKVLLLWVKNKVQHMIIRMRVWFSNDRMIDCNHARCLFENLLKMISSSKYSDLGRICSPSLVPHLKSVYFLDGYVFVLFIIISNFIIASPCSLSRFITFFCSFFLKDNPNENTYLVPSEAYLGCGTCGNAAHSIR